MIILKTLHDLCSFNNENSEDFITSGRRFVFMIHRKLKYLKWSFFLLNVHLPWDCGYHKSRCQHCQLLFNDLFEHSRFRLFIWELCRLTDVEITGAKKETIITNMENQNTSFIGNSNWNRGASAHPNKNIIGKNL